MNIKTYLVVGLVFLSVSNTILALNGQGTQADPFLISSLSDFDEFADDPNFYDDYIRLESDIDLGGRTYDTAVIAVHSGSGAIFQGTVFSGVFDGNGFEIIDLVINDGGADKGYLGLFGKIDGGEVRNLGIEGGSVSGYLHVGSLAGDNSNGIISKCYSTGTVSGSYGVGGLAGDNSGGISNCYATGFVDGVDGVGGLTGGNGGSISNCYAIGDVIGNDVVGGLVGGSGGQGSISNCYSTGSVSGNDKIGGLVGSNSQGSISNCYSIGDVDGAGGSVGGLVGYNFGSINDSNYWYACISNCFWNTSTQSHGVTESIGYSTGGKITNVVGKTTTQLQTESTFTDAGWDFIGDATNGTSETWQMPVGSGYPVLSILENTLLPVSLSGSGTAGDPYLVGNPSELGVVCWYPSQSCFKLTSNIDLSGINWSTSIMPVFYGNFDGDNHTIINMQISGGSHLGLFGYVKGSQISNLALEGGSVSGDYNIGTLVGYNSGGSISNCSATGDVSGVIDVGGLMGDNRDGSISQCYSTGSVDAEGIVGSLLGRDHSGVISNCYSTGSADGGTYVSGLVGVSYNDNISNCYSTGPIEGVDRVGGLCGETIEGNISNCHSISDVNGVWQVGGLIGSNWDGTVSVSHYIGSVVGLERVGGLVGYKYDSNIENSYSAGSVRGSEDVGGLVGETAESSFQYSHILNCHSISSVYGGHNTGGLIGRNVSCNTYDSYSTGNVSGYTCVGGLVGSNSGGSTSGCYSTGDVTASLDYAGGLVGGNEGAFISDCYSKGSVSGRGEVGGLVGFNSHSTNVSNCYSISDVNGIGDCIGGVGGSNDSFGSISNSFWDTETQTYGVTDSIGCEGGGTVINVVGETTVHMQTESTFTIAGWDFSDVDGNPAIWQMPVNDYPYLAWQDSVPVFVDVPGVVNMSQVDAESEIVSAGLVVGTVTNVHNTSLPTGTVISQSPLASITVLAGSSVDIVVSFDPSLQGQGTQADPYIIQSSADFIEFTDPNNEQLYWGAGVYIRLGNDLSLSGTGVNQIGFADTNAYYGFFDGSGHSITELTLDLSTSAYVGLFGYVGESGEIKNLCLTDVDVYGDEYVGGLCGRNNGGKIINCQVTGNVEGRGGYVGGLCGYNTGGIIRNCSAESINVDGFFYVGGLVGSNRHWEVSENNWTFGLIANSHATGSVLSDNSNAGGLVGYNSGIIRMSYADAIVTADSRVGGLVGYNTWNESDSNNIYAPGTILTSYSAGNVQGFVSSVGGLVGENSGNIRMSYATGNVNWEIGVGTDVGGLAGRDKTDRITDCYATGDVKGTDNVGGLIGRSGEDFGGGDGYGAIERCYSIGTVVGDSNVGGLIGFLEFGDIDASFWNTEASGQASSDGGTGLTTAQMQDRNTFINAGWNLEKPIWTVIDEPNYPTIVIWGAPDVDDSGKVDFTDFSLFATNWMDNDCGICEGVDFAGDRQINISDLIVFSDKWLSNDQISDHLFKIDMYTGWNYGQTDNPSDTEYMFELSLLTDDRVQRIEFLAPSGNLFKLPCTPFTVTVTGEEYIISGWDYESSFDVYGGNKYEWFYEASYDEASDLDAYGDGWYTFTVYYDNGRQHQTDVFLGNSATSQPLPQPTQEPVPISPDSGASVNLPVVFTWQPCTDPNAFFIHFDVENDSTGDESGPDGFLAKETISWGPADLSDGLWEAEISFGIMDLTQNSDGIDISVIKYSSTEYDFTVIP